MFAFFLIRQGGVLRHGQANINAIRVIPGTDAEKHAVFPGQPVQQSRPWAGCTDKRACRITNRQVDYPHILGLWRHCSFSVKHSPHRPQDPVFKKFVIRDMFNPVTRIRMRIRLHDRTHINQTRQRPRLTVPHVSVHNQGSHCRAMLLLPRLIQ